MVEETEPEAAQTNTQVNQVSEQQEQRLPIRTESEGNEGLH
jgi:hypothetical protein